MTHGQSDRYAIVPIAPGPVPKEAIVVGNIDQVFEYIPQSVARDDAMKELEAARFTHEQIAHAQERTRAVQVLMLNEALDRLTSRQDSFATKQRERRKEAKARRDAAEAKRIQAALDALPDPDDPHAFASTPAKIRDDEPPAPLSKDAEPSLKLEDQSNLPNELLEGVPPAPATYPIDPDPDKGTVYPQPISVSLNKD
jgi:hypothetical protein